MEVMIHFDVLVLLDIARENVVPLFAEDILLDRNSRWHLVRNDVLLLDRRGALGARHGSLLEIQQVGSGFGAHPGGFLVY